MGVLNPGRGSVSFPFYYTMVLSSELLFFLFCGTERKGSGKRDVYIPPGYRTGLGFCFIPSQS